MLDTKIVNLEIRVAFQEDTINQLNSIIIEQQKILDKLQAQMGHVIRYHEERTLQFQISNENNDIPPHY